MSKRFASKNEPKNSGENRIYTLNTGSLEQIVHKVLNVSLINGEIVFERSNELLFSLLLNEDILSIVPRVELEINGKDVSPDNMYILDINDKITFEDKSFLISEKVEIPETPSIPKAHELTEESETPPDITLEMKIPAKEVKKKKEKKKKKDKKKKNKPLNTIEKPKNVIRDKRSANSLVRIIAIIIEVIIVAIIMEFVVIDQEVLDLMGVNKVDLTAFKVDFDMSIINSIIAGTLIFQILRVLTAFIFGVTLGQLLIGVYEVNGVIAKRIKGLFRELIGVFTGGFIILDLPSLIGKRTFKEVITASNIKSSGFFKTFLLTILFVPLFFGLWLAAPILSYEGGLNPINVNPTVLKTRDNKEFESTSSKKFNLSFDSSLNYLPFLYTKRVGRKIVSLPELKIYTENPITLKYVKTIDLRELIKTAIGNNFLVSFKYPLISRIAFSDKKAKAKIKYDQQKLAKEFLMLIKDALALNLESAIDHVIVNGPFVKGYLNFRKTLYKNLDYSFTSVNYKKLAGRDFIEFKANAFQSRLLEINLEAADVISIKTRERGYDKFFKSFSNESYKKGSLISLVDSFLSKDFSQTNLEVAFRTSFDYLKSSLESEDESLSVDIIDSFSTHIKYLNTIKKTIKDENEKTLIDKYIQNLSDLIRAYKEKDKSFFGFVEQSSEVESNE